MTKRKLEHLEETEQTLRGKMTSFAVLPKQKRMVIRYPIARLPCNGNQNQSNRLKQAASKESNAKFLEGN